MSFLDKFLNGVKLTTDEDYDEYDDYEEEYEDEKEKKPFFRFARRSKDNEEEDLGRPSAKVMPFRSSRNNSPSQKMQVCVIKPSSFEDVKEIADTLLSNCTIILNMEGIDLALAQRIIDFMTGSCYSIDGNLQKVSNYIFIITPAIVGISGDLQGIVDAFETTRKASGQSFSAY